MQERGRLVLVPQALTRDWGGSMPAARMVAMHSAPALIGAAMDLTVGRMKHMSMGPPQECSAPPSQCDRDGMIAEDYFPPSADTPDHDAVTLLQRADGSWKLDKALAKAVGLTVKRMQAPGEKARWRH